MHRLLAILASVCLVALSGGVQRIIHDELDHAGGAGQSTDSCCVHSDAASPNPDPPSRPHDSRNDCPTCITLALTAAAPAAPASAPVAGLVATPARVPLVAAVYCSSEEAAPRSSRGPPA